jgi:acyl-CoA thioester hydrolase
VPYADTDQMCVVYYANYLVYFERARSAALRQVGLPYSQLEERGLYLPVAEAYVNYIRSARFEDTLTLDCAFEVVSPVRIKAVCSVRRDGETLADGHTIHVCLDAARGRPTKIPPDLCKLFTAHA